MDLTERTLGEAGRALIAEGGGSAGGFVGGAFLGRQIQNLIKPDSAIVSTTDKLLAWGGNNVPKLALWWMGRGYTGVGTVGEAVSDARKALAGSVVFDTIIRLSHAGTNPATASIFGYEVLGNGGPGGSGNANVQQVLNENASLRNELNKALQKLAEMQPPGTSEYREIYPGEGMDTTPQGVQQRQKKYSFAAEQAMQQFPRQRRYAFMESAGFKNAQGAGSIAQMFGFKEQ